MTREDFDSLYYGKAVHCDTEEKANEFLALADSVGYKWIGGFGMVNYTQWEIYNKETCYEVAKRGFMYADVDFFKNDNYDFIEYQLQPKFKVGDLITDKKILVLIIKVNKTHYKIKYITGSHQDEITNTSQDWVDKFCVKYDLDNPLTNTVNYGKCYCNECSDALHYGDECIRYDGDIYCCENCLMSYIGRHSADSVIGKNDLDDSSTAERPLFDLSKKQIEEIKKEGNRK